MFRQAFLLCLQSVPSSPRPRRPSYPSVQSLFPLQIQSAVTKWKLLSPSVWENSRGSGCDVPLWHFPLYPCGQLMTTQMLFASLTEPLAGGFFPTEKTQGKLSLLQETKTRVVLGIMKLVKEPSLQRCWWRWNSHRAPGAKIIERDDMRDEVSQFWLEIQNRSQIIQIKGSVRDRGSPSKATQPAHRPPAAVLSLVCKKTINRLVQNDSESVGDVSEILNWFPWGEGLLMGKNWIELITLPLLILLGKMVYSGQMWETLFLAKSVWVCFPLTC